MNIPAGRPGHSFYNAFQPGVQTHREGFVSTAPCGVFFGRTNRVSIQLGVDTWLHQGVHEVQLSWLTAAIFHQIHFMALASMMAPAPMPRFRESSPSQSGFRAHQARTEPSFSPRTAPQRPARTRPAATSTRGPSTSRRTNPDRPSAPQTEVPPAAAEAPPAAGGAAHEQQRPSYEAPPREQSQEAPRNAERMTPEQRLDYLHQLGLNDHNATASQIKKAYQAMALRCHPDKTVGLPEDERKRLTEQFKLAANAYEALLNPDKQPEAAPASST